MNLDQLNHSLWLCEQGLRPEQSPIIREQIKAFKAEQDQELSNTLRAAEIYEQNFGGGVELPKLALRHTGTPWFQPMGADEFILKRELRESAEGLP